MFGKGTLVEVRLANNFIFNSIDLGADLSVGLSVDLGVGFSADQGADLSVDLSADQGARRGSVLPATDSRHRSHLL